MPYNKKYVVIFKRCARFIVNFEQTLDSLDTKTNILSN